MASSVAVHASAVQAVRPLNVPEDWHVAVRVAPLEYPAAHVTVIASPVTPVMAPAAEWSESMVPAAPVLDTVHASAVHAVRPLMVPEDKHVAVRVKPPEYPALHVTVTDASVTAVMLPAVA